MDYLSDKVTVLVGEASSRVNDTRRKWQQQQQQHQSDNKTQLEAGPDTVQQSSAIDVQLQAPAPNATRGRRSNVTRQSPLAGGMPFGGDTFTRANSAPRPPPIGFRTDLADQNPETTPRTSPNAKGAPLAHRTEHFESDESLYKGDAWARLWFQRVMILSLLRLLLFIRKVYEDFQATKVYNLTGQTGHFLIAAATLFLPTIVFTIYRVSRYLQVALPPMRVNRDKQQPYPDEQARPSDGQSEEAKKKKGAAQNEAHSPTGARDDVDDDDDVNDQAQLTRALMSPSAGSVSAPAKADSNKTPTGPAGEDNEGLVTARQTPTNLDEFHDSKSQQESSTLDLAKASVASASKRVSQLRAEPSPRADSAEPAQAPGALRVDKLLADSTDRETTRVVTGASEQLLHGVLFIFWQLKRQVDVMGYLVERACLWRKPAEQEKEQLGRLRTGSDGLEWFQDFYAAFLAILAQVYTLGLHWSGNEGLAKQLSATQLAGATSGLSAPNDAASSGADLSISNSARAVSSLLGSQAIAGNTLAGKDVLIMSELIVSTAVVLSLLIAVGRRDDGPMTLTLSMLGWGSLFSARIVIIALSFVHLGWHLMLPLIICHVLFVTGWIYKIALASHNDEPCERMDEAIWDEETAAELSNQLEMEQPKEGAQENAATLPLPTSSQSAAHEHLEKATSKWTIMEHAVLTAQILTLFAIPSLFYWPIMFNLKLHFRPFKYLVLILLENFLLIPAIWLSILEAEATPGQLYLLGFVGGFSIVGFIFITLYIMCKPSLTEYFARADGIFNEAEKSGIYYEFCSRVFKMPDLSKQTFRRLMNQSEVRFEEAVEGEEE